MRASHEFLDHGSELKLRLRAGSLADLFAESVPAMGALLRRAGGDAHPAPPREVVVDGRDPAALLVHWINELLFVSEVERWVPTEVEDLALSDDGIRARVAGVTLSAAPAFVKAATFHELVIQQVGDGMIAEVVLDV